MKTIITSIFAFFLTASSVFAQNNVEFSASENWVGYMNVFQLPENGGGYEFGSAWEVSSLKSTIDISENSLVLQPNYNTYAPGDEYWVNPSTLQGNKEMEAITFVEPGDSFNGQDLTFSGAVMANTLADGYTASVFIKALDPNNDYQDALGGAKVIALPESGSFSISATGAELAAGLLIQYGFAIYGPNANPDDEAALGSIRIGNMISSTDDGKEFATKVVVSPNPAQDLLSIISDERPVSYEIKNLSGQLLLKGSGSNVNIETLASGFYLAIVDLGDTKEVVKFMKN